MGKAAYQTSDETLILDLVRLGLDGDAGSVRQLGRQILRGRGASKSEGFREELGRLLLEDAGSALRSAAPSPLPVEDEAQMPLVERRSDPVVEPPVLDTETEKLLESLVSSRQRASELLDAGIEPPRTVLLTGPPGVGKTMTASSLAVRLELPLLTVELAALMSSFLGRTGQNLRRVLDHARSEPCVLFLDEFDAVAKRRDDVTDIGELKRLVNLLLLEIDNWPLSGLLVAATNHPQLLDPAVGRRFDLTIELGLPRFAQRREIIARAAARFRREEPGIAETVIDACALAFEGATGSDLERAMAEAGRVAVLEGVGLGDALSFLAIARLEQDVSESRSRRAAFAALANEQLGMPQRDIAEFLGVSHPTVGKLIKEWRSGKFKHG